MQEQQRAAQQTVQTVSTVKHSRTPTPQELLAHAGNQLDILRQAETIKQLQGQVKFLEKQSSDASKVFVGTMTALITSAFALVAALAWNDAVQTAFSVYFKSAEDAVLTKFLYALLITLIVMLIIYLLIRLNRRVGGRSLLDDVKNEGGGKKEEAKAKAPAAAAAAPTTYTAQSTAETSLPQHGRGGGSWGEQSRGSEGGGGWGDQGEGHEGG